MTLELYYDTELGAVIDRCIAIRVFHIAIYLNTLFGVSLHPYKAPIMTAADDKF